MGICLRFVRNGSDPLGSTEGPPSLRENGVRREKVPLGGAFTKYACSRKGFQHSPQSRQLVRSSVELRPWSRGMRGDKGRRQMDASQSGRPPKSLDVGGSALSALPGVNFGSVMEGASSTFQSPTAGASSGGGSYRSRVLRSDKSNTESVSNPNGGSKSKERCSRSTLVSKASTVQQEGSINFKGKSAWWDRKEPRHSQILYHSRDMPSGRGKGDKKKKKNRFMPSTGSLAFERDLRARFGFVD